jgi:AraC-like DNA-binding protein
LKIFPQMSTYQEPLLAETEFASGLRLICGLGITHDFPRHVHQSLLLVLITKGIREMDLPRETVRIKAGQGFCLPPDYPHACRSFEPHDYFAVSIPDALWRDMQAEDAQLPGFTLFENPGPGLAALEELITVLQIDPDPMAIESALFAVQSEVQPGTLPQQSSLQKAMVEQVRNWLLEHFTEPVRLADLAILTGWSAGMVNRVFRQNKGVPPYEFLLHQRLREVARLLRSCSQSLADIAIATGFSDQSHMQRLFRRAYGVTPKAYRDGAVIVNQPKPAAD